MSVLSGPEIQRLHEQSAKDRFGGATAPYLRIDPWPSHGAGPNSVDLTLGDEVLVYDLNSRLVGERVVAWLDPRLDNPYFRFPIPADGFRMVPGHLYLASTAERIEAHGLVPVIETRSSLARLGVSTHLSAGFCDDGFAGTVTLEITVVHPVVLYPGMRICQVAFHALQGDRQPYRGKYLDQSGPVPSRLHEEGQGA